MKPVQLVTRVLKVQPVNKALQALQVLPVLKVLKANKELLALQVLKVQLVTKGQEDLLRLVIKVLLAPLVLKAQQVSVV